MRWTIFFLGCGSIHSNANKSRFGFGSLSAAVRGGATATTNKASDVYTSLAKALEPQLRSEEDINSPPSVKDIVKAFRALASAQQTFKGLDGAAHEAYQRTHDSKIDAGVTGRAQRTAARASASADALGACELCELIETPGSVDLASANGTLVGRQVLFNQTGVCEMNGIQVNVLVLYEKDYNGGAGPHHGGLGDVPLGVKRANGRVLIILGDSANGGLSQTLQCLVNEPIQVRLTQGLLAGEAASVQQNLYQSAVAILHEIEPILRTYNDTAIHITGRSLAGGVAVILATILHGQLPLPRRRRVKSESKVKTQSLSGSRANTKNNATNATVVVPLQGLGRDRTSAVALGAPPAMSANVPADFMLSILYGDDVVPRLTHASIDRLVRRTRRNLNKGVLGRQLGRMTDTFSLAVSNLKSHAHGSEGEESRLATPGRAYLVRPRRLGGSSSMHEIGGQLKGGREALRAAVLWQLNDILLTKSLWKHHTLASYIHGIDRLQLRGLNEDEEHG